MEEPWFPVDSRTGPGRRMKARQRRRCMALWGHEK